MWAALDVIDAGSSDRLLLALDDFQVTALEDRDETGAQVRVFFANAVDRDQALAGLPASFEAHPVDVADEDWARRSQQNLVPVTVGRITVFPTPESIQQADAAGRDASLITILIPPSMGFGTGHHATTRLCLAALQALDLSDRLVVDVGTGSGVLALAARLLGARAVVGIDYDADAIQSAEENLDLNRTVDHVVFEQCDLRHAHLAPADVVVGNLTGAVIIRESRHLRLLAREGGTLIVSGVQLHERNDVFSALAPGQLIWEGAEDGWVGAAFTLTAASEV